MLIDDRAPAPEAREPIDVNWRMVGWLAVSAVLVFAGIHTAGFVAYLILCTTVYAVCKALLSVRTYDFGLREWRQ